MQGELVENLLLKIILDKNSPVLGRGGQGNCRPCVSYMNLSTRLKLFWLQAVQVYIYSYMTSHIGTMVQGALLYRQSLKSILRSLAINRQTISLLLYLLMGITT